MNPSNKSDESEVREESQLVSAADLAYIEQLPNDQNLLQTPTFERPELNDRDKVNTGGSEDNSELVVSSNPDQATSVKSSDKLLFERKRKTRTVITAITIILVSSAALLPMLNEDVDTQLTLFSEKLASKASREGKTARFYRLISDYGIAYGTGRKKKAFALLYALIDEAKSWGDNERLLIASLIEAGEAHNHEALSAISQDYPNPKANDPVMANFEKAKEIAREAIAITKKLHGERNMETARAYKILANAKSRFDSQDPNMQKAIWCAERCEGPFGAVVGVIDVSRFGYRTEFKKASDPIEGLKATALHEEELHHFEKAEQSYLRWVNAANSKFGNNHPVTAVAMNSYACFLRGQARFFEAEQLEMRVDQIWKNEQDHPTWNTKR